MTRTPEKNSWRPMGGISPAVVLPWLLLIGLSLYGADYYLADLGTRARHPLHPWLEPSGWIGQTAGLLTFAGFAFLWLYPLRKRLGARAKNWGPMADWLEVHIVVGLTIPLLGAVHAGWRFDGLIGLGYFAMLVVSLSGIIGRYVYVRIPRSRSGVEIGAADLAQRRRQLLVDLAGITGLARHVVESTLAADPVPPGRRGVLASLVQMVRDDFARRRAAQKIRRAWEALGPDRPPLDEQKLEEVARLAHQEMALDQQLRLLESSQRIFGYWHAFHKPVAVSAFVAVSIHVIVVVLVGATWFY